jgi:hypothetical protein
MVKKSAKAVGETLICTAEYSLEVYLVGEIQEHVVNKAVDKAQKAARDAAWDLAKRFLRAGKKVIGHALRYSTVAGVANCAVDCVCKK